MISQGELILAFALLFIFHVWPDKIHKENSTLVQKLLKSPTYFPTL